MVLTQAFLGVLVIKFRERSVNFESVLKQRHGTGWDPCSYRQCQFFSYKLMVIMGFVNNCMVKWQILMYYFLSLCAKKFIYFLTVLSAL